MEQRSRETSCLELECVDFIGSLLYGQKFKFFRFFWRLCPICSPQALPVGFWASVAFLSSLAFLPFLSLLLFRFLSFTSGPKSKTYLSLAFFPLHQGRYPKRRPFLEQRSRETSCLELESVDFIGSLLSAGPSRWILGFCSFPFLSSSSSFPFFILFSFLSFTSGPLSKTEALFGAKV